MEKIHVVTVVTVVSKIEEELSKKCLNCPLRGSICLTPKPSLECLLKFNVVDEAYKDIVELLERLKMEKTKETPQTPQTTEKDAEGVISQKEAQTELISEKPESSSSGVSGVFSEKDNRKEIIISKENIEALQEAVKPYGSDYWLASDVEADYARAGGREFWRLINFLSSEEWIRSNPQIWLEKYPGMEGMFRLRRR